MSDDKKQDPPHSASDKPALVMDALNDLPAADMGVRETLSDMYNQVRKVFRNHSDRDRPPPTPRP